MFLIVHAYRSSHVLGKYSKPLNKGHTGEGPFVPSRELALFLEVFFKPIGKSEITNT